MRLLYIYTELERVRRESRLSPLAARWRRSLSEAKHLVSIVRARGLLYVRHYSSRGAARFAHDQRPKLCDIAWTSFAGVTCAFSNDSMAAAGIPTSASLRAAAKATTSAKALFAPWAGRGCIAWEASPMRTMRRRELDHRLC